MNLHNSKSGRGNCMVDLGGIKIGGGNPVVVQTMTNTPTSDAAKTIAQIRKVARAGCEVARLAVPDQESAKVLPEIISGSPIPLVADIHFDPKLALLSLDAGIHGLRLNPGNIRNRKALREIVREAETRKVPIRVGVNSGSVAKDIREKWGDAASEALVESAMEHISLLEEIGFGAIKVSLKASDVLTTVDAYRKMRALRDYPLHLGITEAGTAFSGLVKSAAGLGILLAEGIGDTIRVSLAADPLEEVRAAYSILRALGLRNRGVEVIACPTCARARLDVIKTASAIERKLQYIAAPLKIAVMGCGVNGPGEARHADFGAVGTPKGIQLYVAGERAGSVEASKLIPWLVKMAQEKSGE